MNTDRYQVMDTIPDEELIKLESPDLRNVYAVPTGETRFPRVGEWYLSAENTEAHRALKDLSTEYRIARLIVDD